MLLIVIVLFIIIDTMMIINFRKDNLKENNNKYKININNNDMTSPSSDIYNNPNIKKLIKENQETYYEIKRNIESMNFKEFEEWTAVLFRKLGYEANVSIKNKHGYDGGKDVIVKDRNGEIIFIECKRWNDKCDFTKYKVGREICQKLIGSMMSEGVKKGIVITSGEIHKNSEKYIKDLKKHHPEIDLELWDLNKIINVYMNAHGLNTKNNIILV